MFGLWVDGEQVSLEYSIDLEEPEEGKGDDAETAAFETGEGGAIQQDPKNVASNSEVVIHPVIADEGATIYDVIQAAEDSAAPAHQQESEESK